MDRWMGLRVSLELQGKLYMYPSTTALTRERLIWNAMTLQCTNPQTNDMTGRVVVASHGKY